MIVVDSEGERISSLEQWRNRYFRTPSKLKQWKEGRSAYSLAQFIIDQQKGVAHLENRITSALSQEVELEQATPEFQARFDSYPGNPSNLDLAIMGWAGRAESKSSLFVGVEAKVIETFGDRVASVYSTGLKKRLDGKNTNAPERVEDLLSKYFSVSYPPESSRFADIRYQLLTGTAGTVATPGEIAVFYILVFRTAMYESRRGLANQRDYENFIGAAHGKSLSQDGNDLRADELRIDGKRLVCIYDHMDM